jgi:hypothetical protein
MHQIRKRLTYANVMSSIAVFLVLGGAAYAASQLPKNSVGTKQLKKNAVTSAKVKNKSLEAVDFKAGQLPAGPQGPPGTVDTSNFYTKSQSDARYLRSTVVVVKTIAASVASENFTAGTVECPSGYQAVSGGVDPNGVFFGKVAASAPSFSGHRLLEVSDGQQGPANGWWGAVTTQGAGTGTGVVKVAVICSPIG